MGRADELMREANSLAETIQHMRGGGVAPKALKGASVSDLEVRLAGLWVQIRAARVEMPGAGSGDAHLRRTRPKWN